MHWRSIRIGDPVLQAGKPTRQCGRCQRLPPCDKEWGWRVETQIPWCVVFHYRESGIRL